MSSPKEEAVKSLAQSDGSLSLLYLRATREDHRDLFLVVTVNQYSQTNNRRASQLSHFYQK